LAELRTQVAETMAPFDALLFAYAETASEWEQLRQMPKADAAAWVAGRRVTPS